MVIGMVGITDEYIKKITKNISRSGIFMVIVTKRYFERLMNNDEKILIHIKVARDLKKQFFIAIDNRLMCSEAMQTNIFFSNDNVIKKTIVDVRKYRDLIYLGIETEELARKLNPQGKEILIVTEDTVDDEHWDDISINKEI